MAHTQNIKKILVLHYSQTGQLDRVLESVIAPLREAPGIQVDTLTLTPAEAFPFPWPLLRFINAFPEAAHQVPCELSLDMAGIEGPYDLVVLGYQVWYLAPSIPVSSFLQSEQAAALLADTPVVTVVACRNMWLQAQEKIKSHLERLEARLIGNIALVDEAGSVLSFFATPLWVLTGRKGPFWFGIPRAGVSEKDITRARRFGLALRTGLDSAQPLDETVLHNTGAVTINDKLIPSEKIATRSFYLWGKLFLACGKPDVWIRQPLAIIYLLFLIAMILTVVPVSALLKKLFAPLLQKRIAKQKAYFAWPSGEAAPHE